MSSSPLALVLAGPPDRAGLERLAALDSAQPLVDPALVAYRDGRLVAALSLADGRTVADPFEHSAGAVELLRVRAAQLRSESALRRRLGARLRPILQLR